MIRAIIKCHGGKSYLKHFIIAQFPVGFEELSYLEPYGGGVSVLLNKPRSKEEFLNDGSFGLVQIYLAIRDKPLEFQGYLKQLTYTEETFKKAKGRIWDFLFSIGHDLKPNMNSAVNEYVLRRMSRGGLGQNFAWSERLRGGQPGDVNAWQTAIESITSISKRLRNVEVSWELGLDLLKKHANNSNAFAYVDPPYLHETRVSKAAYGNHEMLQKDHIELADVLNNFKGKVLLSGYSSSLYDKLFANWNVVMKSIVNHASQKKVKDRKLEVLWMNY